MKRKDIRAYIWEAAHLSTVEKLMALALVDAPRFEGAALIKTDDLAARTGMSVRAVQRATGGLHRKGFINKVVTPGFPNIYQFTADGWPS